MFRLLVDRQCVWDPMEWDAFRSQDVGQIMAYCRRQDPEGSRQLLRTNEELVRLVWR
jgi:hypothetical protein